jgi:hypothetical protein
MEDDRSENEPLDYQPHPLCRPRGPSAKEVADSARARCYDYHRRCGTLGAYYRMYPMDTPPGYWDHDRGRDDR